MGCNLNESEEGPKKMKKSLKRSKEDVTVDGSSERKKLKINEPSVKDLIELNKSNQIKSFFSLQTKELLEATKIKNNSRKRLSCWLQELEKFPNADKVFKQFEESKLSEKIAKKLGNKLTCDKDSSFTFIKPESMGTFGLFTMNALPGPNIEINFYMTMPKKCFNVKDYLNNRYFVKKYFYLMYVAEYLKSQNMCSNIKCAYYNENVLLPYLILCPSDMKKTTVNLFVVPEKDYFKATRYSPDVNNVKVQIFKQEFGDIENIEEFPTTYYNVALAFDGSLTENNNFTEKLFENTPNLQEGIKLIVIWMNQRKIIGSGLYANDLVTYLMTYLVCKGTISKIMTSDQVFRNFLNFIHTTDLSKTALKICDEISEEELLKYKNAFDIVLMDRTGHYNTTSFLDLNTYLKIRYECKLALDLLSQSDSPNSFSNLFLTDVPIYLQYSAMIRVNSENNYRYLLEQVSPKEKAKYVGNYMLLITKIMLENLNKGFNQRVKNIVPIIPCYTQWDYEENEWNINRKLLLGLKLNPDSAYEVIEFGPALNDPEEKNFREFWGNLSSNRRFRDGTAKIVVFFETKTMKDKREIIKTISDYVMGEKLKLKYAFTYNEFEAVALNNNVQTWYPSGTNEETSLKISRSSDDLAQKIRNLKFELGVTGIAGISDVYCYTNVFPPIPSAFRVNKKLAELKGKTVVLKKNKTFFACPRYVEPVECVIQLSHTSKWPGNLDELHKKKKQFLELISNLLEKQYKIVSSVEDYSYINIVYEGIVFRYNLYISKEITLLKRLEESARSKGHQCSELSLEFDKKLIVVPKIVGALKGLHAQYPSYGVSTCIAKRWIRGQLLDDFLLPDIVIDLLNAHQFVHKTLYEQAVTPQNAFLRFLKFLVEVEWDWQPVVVNFSNILSDERILELSKEMDSDRKKFPDLCILTPYDDCDSVFTKKAPSKLVLDRLKLLAKEFLAYFEKKIMEDVAFHWKEIVLPNLAGYDCVLKLKHLLHARRHEDLNIGEKEFKQIYEEPKEDDIVPVIKFNPVDIYIRKLREIYGHLCLFFRDAHGGCFIGVLWKPNLKFDVESVKQGFEIYGKAYNVLESIS